MEHPTSRSSLQIQVLSFQNHPVVSDIMGRLNHHAINNDDINSDVPVDSNYNSIPDPDTTPIKSIDDDEMYHIL